MFGSNIVLCSSSSFLLLSLFLVVPLISLLLLLLLLLFLVGISWPSWRPSPYYPKCIIYQKKRRLQNNNQRHVLILFLVVDFVVACFCCWSSVWCISRDVLLNFLEGEGNGIFCNWAVHPSIAPYVPRLPLEPTQICNELTAVYNVTTLPQKATKPVITLNLKSKNVAYQVKQYTEAINLPLL